jgi:hypothetical protein
MAFDTSHAPFQQTGRPGAAHRDVYGLIIQRGARAIRVNG